MPPPVRNPARPSQRPQSKSGPRDKTRPARLTAGAIPAGWFSASADPAEMVRIGIKREGGGAKSKTMMLTDLTTLLAAAGAGARTEDAIV
jgi:hypothetical protein